MYQSDIYMKELEHDINNIVTKFSILSRWRPSQSCRVTTGSRQSVLVSSPYWGFSSFIRLIAKLNVLLPLSNLLD